MTKIKYIDKKFRSNSLTMIDLINEIIEDYASQGYDLTLRQVYYQLVAKDLIENSERSYKNIGSLVNDGRLAGLISWYAIIDRTRNLKGLRADEDPQTTLTEATKKYRLDKWENQSNRIEVWVEKDALAGVIGQICGNLDVDYFSCRGYTSQSEMWRASQRIKYHTDYKYKDVTILHLGDHDPSGIDMSRDIEERLRMFGAEFDFQRIALNIDQVYEHSLPPNPAKLSDSRAKSYISEYGYESWELDALQPQTLETLINSHVKQYIDYDLLRETEKQEEHDKEKMLEMIEVI